MSVLPDHPMMPAAMEQDFDRFLVLDLEATCIKDMRINPQEILQISALLVDAKDETLPIVASFNQVVKPVFRPKLSPFCIKLTGNQMDFVLCCTSLIDVSLNFRHTSKQSRCCKAFSRGA